MMFSHNALRAGVMGLIDGLVSVILVIAAGFELKYVLGVLLAGSLSMAVAEYASVASQRDAYSKEVGESEEFSPLSAAFSSFLAFSIGGFLVTIPLIPSGNHWDTFSYWLAGIILFISGGLAADFAGTSFIKGAFRLLFAAGIAVFVTFYVGVVFL